eukprot:5704633-Amphidinium_carterae.1
MRSQKAPEKLTKLASSLHNRNASFCVAVLESTSTTLQPQIGGKRPQGQQTENPVSLSVKL